MCWRLAILAGCLTAIGPIQAWASEVGLITVNGPIGPSTAGYICRALDVAAEKHCECLIVELDTPGGLLDSTKVIVQKFLGASIPVVVYVARPGAVAGSAGCFITLAADIAAMSPTTSIGAAHPVAIGGGIAADAEKVDDAMKQKLENYAVNFIEIIAAKRNRNVEWARASVKDSAAISSEKALASNVIDYVATDLKDLLRQMNGRVINGKALKTADAQVLEIPMNTRERLFQVIWRPEVMFILMLVAIYGIIGELSNPGAIFPGVVGCIALIMALYMAAILPVNFAGLALICLAVGLFILDIYATTHGVLTVGGLVAFVIGSVMLFDKAEGAFRLSFSFIIPGAILTALFFAFVIGAGLRAQSLPVRVGKDILIGMTATALTRIDPANGKIFIEGEYWNAVSDTPIEVGKMVVVVEVSGMTLRVKPKN